MASYLVVFVGAGLGGMARHGVNLSVLRILGPGFPAATLLVNVVGSFLMGALTAWFALKVDPGQTWRLFLTTGFLGGFTTFSAFSLDAVLLVQRGETGTAAGYVLASVALSILGLAAGMAAVHLLE